MYLVGRTVPPPLAVEQAALLACGMKRVLSHRSAANLWNLRRILDLSLERALAEAIRLAA